ncbi:MAG: hypothetical protein NXI31_18695 [bacterium]|nr:hypothetical protein [bacterium]
MPRTTTAAPVLLAFFLLLGWLPVGLAAQCQTSWQPGPGVLGLWGDQYFELGRAITGWDPDGPGPAGELIVVGGEFAAAGDRMAPGIAAFDPATDTWSRVGSTLSGEVEVLTVLPDGRLAAGGAMTLAGFGLTGFAVFDGTSWSRLGGNSGGFRTKAIHIRTNGNVLIGGQLGRVDEWNGTSWQQLGSINGTIEALLELPNGDLVAAGNVWVNQVNTGAATWNGTSWTVIPNTPLPLHALALLPNGTMIAGGLLNYPGLRGVMQWTGSGWAALGTVTGPNSRVRTLLVEPNGDVIAGGNFTSTGSGVGRRLARWNGTAWTRVGTTELGDVHALSRLGNGEIAAAADLSGPSARGGVWTFDGSDWSVPGDGLSGTVSTIARRADGTFVIAGDFRIEQGAAVIEDLAEWNGSSWSDLAGGTNGTVYSLLALPNGQVVVGGFFAQAGGVAADNIALWTGTGWAPLGPGLSGPVYELCSLGNGRFAAGGVFLYSGTLPVNSIAIWNGRNAWQALGSGVGPVYSAVTAITKLPTGDLVAGGSFTTAGGGNAAHVARWDGQTWFPIGAGFASSGSTSVSGLWTAPNGDVLAAGTIQSSGSTALDGLARWDGQAWMPFASGWHYDIYGLAWLPAGDLVAVGTFTSLGGTNARHAARWNGTSWSELDGGLDGYAWDLAASGDPLDDRVMVVGSFGRAGAAVAARITTLDTDCPATATNLGAPCPGSAGPLTLTPTALPWLGSTFGATATGLVPGSLAAGLLGLQSPSTPLATLHPTGAPGCDLLASPDSVQFFVVGHSTFDTSWSLPNDPTFAGLRVWHQLVQAELDSSQQLTLLAATNALELVLGHF